MYSSEQLSATSLKVRLTEGQRACVAQGHKWEPRRDPDTVVGTVMSTQSIDAELSNPHPDRLIRCGVTIVSDGRAFFLTDDYLFGYGVLPESFRPCSIALPHKAAPRDGLEDGVVRTAADLITVYCEGERQLSSVDELVAYLNENY